LGSQWAKPERCFNLKEDADSKSMSVKPRRLSARHLGDAVALGTLSSGLTGALEKRLRAHPAKDDPGSK
jgi:hypothetical protein